MSAAIDDAIKLLHEAKSSAVAALEDSKNRIKQLEDIVDNLRGDKGNLEERTKTLEAEAKASGPLRDAAEELLELLESRDGTEPGYKLDFQECIRKVRKAL